MNPFEPPTVDVPGVGGTADQQVSSLANKSVIAGAVGLLCCGVVLGPLAISYANQAEAAMIRNDAGQNQAGMIKTGRVLGYVALVLWFLALLVRVGGFLAR
jgi:hypothetical protein